MPLPLLVVVGAVSVGVLLPQHFGPTLLAVDDLLRHLGLSDVLLPAAQHLL